MNGKRQTIWLVSMLSLMVVLSAYYLFTEDSGVSSPKETAGTIQVDSVKNSSGDALPSTADSGAEVSEVTSQNTDSSADPGAAADTGVAADPNTAADPNAAASSEADDTNSPAAGTDNGKSAADSSSEGAKDQTSDSAPAESAKPDSASADNGKDSASADNGKDSTSADGSASKSDAAVLNEVASQSASASSLFTNYLYERDQKNLKEQQDLMAKINDMDKSPADSAAAQEQLHQLEEKESKITGIEEKLQQQYSEAIVKEEGNSYKVVVLSSKLDVKQAASIIDLVMKELSVSQDKVSVQHVSEE
ncbi:hypothetical protein G5B47_04305 [Paenibacillus sp. 7124]|uniref:Stage III sporulation protein AH n=1 Tax=Paenibacillus apii TaxID=1850370 RepID=A0A6M1PMR5_9BACL|nr:SpoIIIAH-like family protein [Paenibacillus apii]NGM81631.1 hypothetical protein [Paenibacillus apii]NJJ41465.1 hypothetical protein [Paenibacillus apii]